MLSHCIFTVMDMSLWQNKKIYLVNYIFILVKLDQHIQHCFPVHGHSFLPDLGCIEIQKCKGQSKYTLQISGMKSARKKEYF